MGVTRVQTANGIKFRARITIDGKRHNLGFHKTQAEGVRAIEELLEREGIPYEETSLGQRKKEREARKRRDAIAITEEEHGRLHRKIEAEFVFPGRSALYTIGGISSTKRPTFIQRLLGKFKK